MPTRLITEEDVKIHYLVPLLNEYGYKTDCLEFDKAIEVQEGRKRKTIFADVVVYASSRRDAPLILCETKAPTEALSRFVKEQAISYARLLPRIVPIALITNGSQVQVFQTLSKNRVAHLPKRSDLDGDVVNFIVSREMQDALRQEAKHDLFIIDDVQTFKNLLKACHNEIRNNEGYDPTQAFDEMSKVLFCKLYEEKQHPANSRFLGTIFDDTLQRLSVNVVAQIFDETKRDPRYAGLFAPGTRIQLQDRTIRRIVGLFENYDLSLTAFDVKGEAFEYFLGDTFTGGLGEYFTPRNVVEFMVDAVDPKIGDRVIDPFCGTGGFLIYAFEVVNEKIHLQEFSNDEKAKWREDLSNRCIFGTDWKERTSQACKMNMMVHGDGSSGILMHHGLVDMPGVIDEGAFNLCITNPPFGSIENDPVILMQYELGQGRRSQERVVLAIERALRLVRPGGLVAIIIIDGVLNNRSMRYVRDYVRQNAWVRGIVSLAEVTFSGYGAGAKTSILFLEKKVARDNGEQCPVFMAIAGNTGYAPNGAQVAGNQLPDILLEYRAFVRDHVTPADATESWVCELEDRLDAEFYWRPERLTIRDAVVVQQECMDLTAHIGEEQCILRSEMVDAFAGGRLESRQLNDVLMEVCNSERIEADHSYRLLGVHLWGKGAFAKDDKMGREIKAISLNRVETGWLIYNRLFAGKGSFAVLGAEHDACYVSGEFPTFAARPGIEQPELMMRYVAYCLNSPSYLGMLEAACTGSTKGSRSRYNQKLLLALEMLFPQTVEQLERIVGVMSRADNLRAKQQELQVRIGELHDAVSFMLPGPLPRRKD